MRIHVVGGDGRFARLAESLHIYGECEGEAYVFGNADFNQEAFLQIDDNALVMVFSPKKFMAERPVVNLLEEEEFLSENAWLTAEGAVVCAAQHIKRALIGSKCLIIGYGRIGKALTELLIGLKAQPVVYARREEVRKCAMQRGAQVVKSIRDGIADADIVFSTPPEMVLDEKILAYAPKNALILDLASAPFGVDLNAAERLGLNAWREGGIPGRYCPESAADILAKAVKRVIDREGRK